MTYKLPSISPEINDNVEDWYTRNPKYADMLFWHCLEHNPLLLQPLGGVPEEIEPFTKTAVLTTIRKLEIQAKRDGKTLPKVTKDTIDAHIAGLAAGSSEPVLVSATRFGADNEPLFLSNIELSADVPRKMRQYIQYPVIYTLVHIENQGRADEDPTFKGN